eukprot:m.358220 g.358220  ORF g.358220 m.358220 type:complete len:697 (+) comp18075_c0_seq1:560-2650(+)
MSQPSSQSSTSVTPESSTNGSQSTQQAPSTLVAQDQATAPQVDSEASAPDGDVRTDTPVDTAPDAPDAAAVTSTKSDAVDTGADAVSGAGGEEETGDAAANPPPVQDGDGAAADEAEGPQAGEDLYFVPEGQLPAVATSGTSYVAGICVECEEAIATLTCDECTDEYCEECFNLLHRKGKRAQHTRVNKKKEDLENVKAQARVLTTVDVDVDASENPPLRPLQLLQLERNSPEWFRERAKFIPVRLSMTERKRLRLMKGMLVVSEYTTKVDHGGFASKAKRDRVRYSQLCSVLTGLALGTNYEIGEKLTVSKDFAKYEPFYHQMFEICRRHKIMNPEKMRTTYGKLLCMVQDSCDPELVEGLGFHFKTPIKTVYSTLKKNQCLGVLDHPRLATATMEILPGDKTRQQIQKEIKEKESAQEQIAREFQYRMKKDDLKWLLYSMSDNNSFLRCARFPVDYMIECLLKHFNPKKAEKGLSLAIMAGTKDARLTHSHEHQFLFVHQTLTLWKQILDDMFRLWYLAEEDFLDSTPYKLTDTGQGLHRLQPAPRIYSSMRAILAKTQQDLGVWIGSSVIHLGDTNVPNALTFIDKYNQVPMILNPIVQTLKEIPRICKKHRDVADWIKKTFKSAENLEKTICHDFFSTGFDGSGADNFYDAGSCIDGRLTSAWNWCNTLPSKPFYRIFCLAGYTNFDGQFQE